MSSVAQLLRQAESLKASVSDASKTVSETWVARQKLEDLYRKMLLMDLEYALDKKIEMELWNFAFKNQITNLQAQAKDKQNVKRAEVQASLNLFLETASGFYLQFLQVICTTFKLDLPFRRKSSYFGIMKEKSPVKLKVTPPKKSSCLYVCQYCLVHLGDIARYRQQIDQAQTYYWHAANLVPFNGQPYNQLAILEAAKGSKLSTVFFYMRSLAVKVPFPVAATNLEKLYAKLAKETPEFKGKLSVSEMITGFLQFHALIHLSSDLKKAAVLCDKLAAGLPAHVTSQSFPWQVLVHIVAINIFAMNYVQNEALYPGVGEQRPRGGRAQEEDDCFELVFRLTVTMLDILLQYTPKAETRVRDYFTLPAIKLLLDWLRLNPEHFNRQTLSSAPLWGNLSKVLNSIHASHSKQSNTDVSKYEELPLPEDAELRCFQPFEKAQSGLSYSRLPSDGLPADVETHLRCQRLLANGQWVMEEFPSLNLSLEEGVKQGRVTFATPPHTTVTINNTAVPEESLAAVSPERRTNRHNVAIQAIIQKQAQESQEKSTQAKSEPSPAKYLLGVPMSQPQFMKAGSGRSQSASTTPSPQSSSKQPAQQPQMILLQNEEHVAQRALAKSGPGGTKLHQQQQQQTPRQVSTWQPQQKQTQDTTKQWQQPSPSQPQSSWQLHKPAQPQQWSPQQQQPAAVTTDTYRSNSAGGQGSLGGQEGQGRPANGMQQMSPHMNMYPGNSSQGKPSMPAAELPPKRFPGQQAPPPRGPHVPGPDHQHSSALHSTNPNPMARNAETFQNSNLGNMEVPLIFQHPPPNFSKLPPPDHRPSTIGSPEGLTPGSNSFMQNRFPSPASSQIGGHHGPFPKAQGQERPQAPNNTPQGQPRQSFPGQQMHLPFQQQGQFGNPYQNFMGFPGLGGGPQKGLSPLDGLFAKSNPLFTGQQQDELSINMADIIGTLSKLAVQPPKGTVPAPVPIQRPPHSTFQGHAEGTPKPENYNVNTTKGLPVPTVNINLDGKAGDTTTTVAGPSHTTTQQGTYSLFSGSPWLSSADSKSLGSSPFSSQSSSIRNSPDPSDAYNPETAANLELGLRFSKSQDWGSKPPPSPGPPPPPPGPGYFPNTNNMQSLWSSGQGQSPLERLLELQKQQRQTEPH